MIDFRPQWMMVAGTVVLVGSLLFGCAARPAATTAAAPAPGAASTAPGTSGQAGQSTPPSSAAPARTATMGSTATAAAAADLKDIHFDFDQDKIRKSDATLLDKDAKWLNGNAQQAVLIEGHCDERGTNEYNLALGDRRAKAAMNYLVSRGVEAKRISMVTYGEDRPICREHTEACWAKNRRGHLIAKAQ